MQTKNSNLHTRDMIIAFIQNPVFGAKVYFYKRFILRKELMRLRDLVSAAYSEENAISTVAGAGFNYKEVIIYLLVKKYKPRLMIETGVANGATSYFILKAMHDNGKGNLISVDYPLYKGTRKDPFHLPKDKKPGWIIPPNLKKRWKLIIGKSSVILPKLDEKIDIFFHDSEHSYRNMMFEYNWALIHVRKNGLILSDDINWNTAFKEFFNLNNNSLRLIKLPVYGGAVTLNVV